VRGGRAHGERGGDQAPAPRHGVRRAAYGRHERRSGTAAGGDERGGQAGELLLAHVAPGKQRQAEDEHRGRQQHIGLDADERQRRQREREAGEREQQLTIASCHACSIVTDVRGRRNQERSAPIAPTGGRLLYVPVLMGGGSFKHGRVASLGALLGMAVVLGTALPAVAMLLAPALALFAVLLLGFTPGERLLERMRARRFTCRAARAPRTLAVRRVVVVRRMTSPAASALAMRPPPSSAPALIS
jgi:hypothetical protein